MAETTPPTDAAPAVPQPERIEDLRIEQELQDSYLTYAMSTIMDRALPDVRDGLKPSQRRILVAMNDLGLGPRSKHRKCAKIAGDTSGNYHPHGEAVIYPTLVRLAQDWTLRSTLIDGQGNFGSTDGDPPAAMRYTEARMTGVAMELMADLEYDTVDLIPNYDETRTEPTVFPSKFPNLLVNGSTGIAVGMACNLLPHNPREICDAIVRVIDQPDVSLAELVEIVPGPDFPTGGTICGRDGIGDGYRTGRGKICLRAKVDVEEQGRGQRPIVVISELPYGIIRKTIMESIASNVKDGVINEISDVNDHSGRQHKVRIVVDLKRDADPQVVVNQLYKHTPCQITVSMINIALVNRQPRTMGLKELIQHFIAHRKEVITRRTRFLLRKAQQRAHILEGLIFAVCDIDEVVRLIRSSKTREEAIAKLRRHAFRISRDHPSFAAVPERLLLKYPGLVGGPDAPPAAAGSTMTLLSQAQAEAIGRLQLIQLVGLEIEKLANEYREVDLEIQGYERILASDAAVLAIIRADTLGIRERYGDDRRTRIEGAASDMNLEDLIAREEMVVTVSHAGYVKRLPVTTYRSQGRGGRGIKGTESREGDFVEQLFVANTHDHLLFFTNKGRVYERRVFDVPQGSRTSMGRSVAQLLEFQPGEKVASTLAVKDFGKEEQFLLFATCKGVVKKTPLSAYGNIRTNGIIAISLDEADPADAASEPDELIGVQITNGTDDVILGTKSGLAIRFGEQDVRSMGRQAGGVTGARFKRANDEVISLIVIPNGQSDSLKLLTATQKGYGKRTPLAEYPVKGRGTRGVINIEASERNGDVVAMKLVGDADEVIFITQAGILMRTKVVEIRETGRGAQGVRLIKIDDGDRLVAMAKVDPEEAKVEDGGEAADADGAGAGVQALSTDSVGEPLPEPPETDGKVADGHAPDAPPAAGRDGEIIDPEG